MNLIFFLIIFCFIGVKTLRLYKFMEGKKCSLSERAFVISTYYEHYSLFKNFLLIYGIILSLPVYIYFYSNHSFNGFMYIFTFLNMGIYVFTSDLVNHLEKEKER